MDMSFQACTPEEFEMLYTAYLRRKGLFEHLKIHQGDRVLDIGGGYTLRGSKYAVEHGAKVVCVDPVFRVHEIFNPKDGIVKFSGTLWQYIGSPPAQEYDLAFCQQGVNYWFKEPHTIQGLAFALKKGGRFVFDTFWQKPPTWPTFKQYNIDGKIYGETVYCVDDVVYHWQSREGVKPHSTSFHWIPRTEFLEVLTPLFSNVEVITEGKTDTYICRK